MKKPRLLILLILCFCCISAVLTACGNTDETTENTDFYRVYLAYTENGGNLSYDEWLSSIKGENGKTPYIGDNGNWFIGETDTGIKALGKDGEKGEKGDKGNTPYIGDNGNWFIGETDTGVKALAKDGENGKSAYEIYKEKVGYDGTEEEWLDDLINGRLGTTQEYTITFDSNGGTACEEQQVKRGDFISSLPIPEKYGYEFNFWRIGDIAIDYFIPVLPIFKDYTFTAEWSPKEYLLSFDFGCAIEELDDPNYYKDYYRSIRFDETVSLPTPSRSGYIFDGWYYNDKKCENGYWKQSLDDSVFLVAKWSEIPLLALSEIDADALYYIADLDLIASFSDGYLNALSGNEVVQIPIYEKKEKNYFIITTESNGLISEEGIINFCIIGADKCSITLLYNKTTYRYSRFFSLDEAYSLRATDLTGNYDIANVKGSSTLGLFEGIGMRISSCGELLFAEHVLRALGLDNEYFSLLWLKIDDKYVLTCCFESMFDKTRYSGRLAYITLFEATKSSDDGDFSVKYVGDKSLEETFGGGFTLTKYENSSDGTQYTISFDWEKFEPLTVTAFSYVYLPTPFNPPYDFNGWYYNGRQYETGYWDDTDINSDITLTASWSRKPGVSVNELANKTYFIEELGIVMFGNNVINVKYEFVQDASTGEKKLVECNKQIRFSGDSFGYGLDTNDIQQFEQLYRYGITSFELVSYLELGFWIFTNRNDIATFALRIINAEELDNYRTGDLSGEYKTKLAPSSTTIADVVISAQGDVSINGEAVGVYVKVNDVYYAQMPCDVGCENESFYVIDGNTYKLDIRGNIIAIPLMHTVIENGYHCIEEILIFNRQ